MGSREEAAAMGDTVTDKDSHVATSNVRSLIGLGTESSSPIGQPRLTR